jgi:hypothetical protein
LFQKSVTFLGHVVSKQGINTDPEKVKAVHERHKPRCLEDVRSFLGVVGYYRSHVPQYADIAAPLRWGMEEQTAFQQLKNALLQDTILAHPRAHVEEDKWVVENVSCAPIIASLRWWKTMETAMPDVMRKWLLHIFTYDVEIEYRPGRLHGNADGLSCPTLIENCHARSCICAQAREN